MVVGKQSEAIKCDRRCCDVRCDVLSSLLLLLLACIAQFVCAVSTTTNWNRHKIVGGAGKIVGRAGFYSTSSMSSWFVYKYRGISRYHVSCVHSCTVHTGVHVHLICHVMI